MGGLRHHFCSSPVPFFSPPFFPPLSLPPLHDMSSCTGSPTKSVAPAGLYTESQSNPHKTRSDLQISCTTRPSLIPTHWELDKRTLSLASEHAHIRVAHKPIPSKRLSQPPNTTDSISQARLRYRMLIRGHEAPQAQLRHHHLRAVESTTNHASSFMATSWRT